MPCYELQHSVGVMTVLHDRIISEIAPCMPNPFILKDEVTEVGAGMKVDNTAMLCVALSISDRE